MPRCTATTVEELEGAPLSSLLSEQTMVDFPERHALIQRDGGRTFESEHVRKDGTTFPAEVNVAVLTDENGRELYSVVHQQDITERRRTERELVQRQEMFAAAVESMLDAFAIARAVRDERGRIVDFEYEYVNDAACRAHRRPREETVGQRMLDLLPGYVDAGILRPVRVGDRDRRTAGGQRRRPTRTPAVTGRSSRASTTTGSCASETPSPSPGAT